MIRLPLETTPAYSATLSYHFGYGSDPAGWHEDLHRWEGRLLWDWRDFGPTGMWLLEFQRRQAPHFHIVVCWQREPNLEQFKRWNDRVWNEIAEPGDELHRRVGCRLSRFDPRSKRGQSRLTHYLAKHSAKCAQKQHVDLETLERLPTGRMWGVFGELPQLEISNVELGPAQLVQLCRRLRRWGRQYRYLRKMGKRYRGGIIMGVGLDVAQLLRGLEDPVQLDSGPDTRRVDIGPPAAPAVGRGSGQGGTAGGR